MSRSRGFTLIELMVAVAIIGILAAIALPAYQEYVMKSRRADAVAALIQLRTDQEKFRFGCTQYADTLVTDGSGTCANTSLNVSSADSRDGFYALSISSADAVGYTLVADPQGAQAGDSACDPIEMDRDGNVTAGCDGK